jgi:hypothetical protein
MIFVISIRNGTLSLSGQQAHIGPRPKEMMELLKDIAPFLPDMDIPISVEDLPGSHTHIYKKKTAVCFLHHGLI